MAMKFTGVAYWTLTTNQPDWISKVLKALEKIESLAKVIYQPLSDRDELSIIINGESHLLMKMGGNGRGRIKKCSTAGAMIVCLLAIKRAAGDLHLVDDLQNEIKSVKQFMPAFEGSDWNLTQQFAQVFELVPSSAFKARNAQVFLRAF